MNSWWLILPNVFVYRLVQVSALRKIPDWPVFLCGLPHITGLENHPETGKMPPYVTDSITILLFETSFDRKDRSAAALFIAYMPMMETR